MWWLRKLLIACLVLVCFGFGEKLKDYSDFKSFYADWEKYKAITKYCYIVQSKWDIKERTILSLWQDDKEAESGSTFREYHFIYVNKDGICHEFRFTNVNWSNYKMFSTGSSYPGIPQYSYAKDAWNTLNE